MDDNLELNIIELKKSLGKNPFSPYLIKLANLYYLSGNYTDCMNLCKSCLALYPDYLTVKIILIKVLVKLEHFYEAEKLLNEIEEKIFNYDIFTKMKNKIINSKSNFTQEKILFSEQLISYKEFNKFKDLLSFNNKKNKNSIGLAEYFAYKEVKDFNEQLIDENDLNKYIDKFQSLCFNQKKTNTNTESLSSVKEIKIDFKIKFFTETLADIYVKQGFLKEAYFIYNRLLENPELQNKEKIKAKLLKLNSSFNKENND